MMDDQFGWCGTTIENRYRIDEVIGEGGFGRGYRATHVQLGTRIAVKCLKLPSHFNVDATKVMLARFREEGQLLSKLSQHPNIVRVVDFGIAEGRFGRAVPYLVLEWLEGEPLDAVI